MSDHNFRCYVALVADNNSRDSLIKGYGLSRAETVENAWHNAGYREEERPRKETERDENGREWHVVYGPRDEEVARYRDEEHAWDCYERIGYIAWECTRRLYDALEETLEVDWERKGPIFDLSEIEDEAVIPA